jgi:hypothetical protein
MCGVYWRVILALQAPLQHARDAPQVRIAIARTTVVPPWQDNSQSRHILRRRWRVTSDGRSTSAICKIRVVFRGSIVPCIPHALSSPTTRTPNHPFKELLSLLVIPIGAVRWLRSSRWHRQYEARNPRSRPNWRGRPCNDCRVCDAHTTESWRVCSNHRSILSGGNKCGCTAS